MPLFHTAHPGWPEQAIAQAELPRSRSQKQQHTNRTVAGENFSRVPTSRRKMNRSYSIIKTSMATAIVGLFLAGTAHATLIWNGSASLGLSVFKNINIQDNGGTYVGNPSPNGSYVKAVNDATYGSIWDFYKD